MERLDNSIKRVWKTEQEILDVIDSVCKENGLCYSLMYGTLLGAVRHHGFIPWDDDIDIIMPRHDYEILIEIWNSSISHSLSQRSVNDTRLFFKVSLNVGKSIIKASLLTYFRGTGLRLRDFYKKYSFSLVQLVCYTQESIRVGRLD